MTSPEQINQQNFPISRGRGYDRAAVRSYLSKLADEHQELLERIAELEDRLDHVVSANPATEGAVSEGDVFDRLGDEISTVLHDAREAATEIRRRVYAEMRQEVSGVLRSSKEAANRMRTTAHEEADGIMTAAKERANQMISHAERRTDELVRNAERRRTELLEDAQRRHQQLEAAERALRERAEKAENALRTLHSALAQDGVSRPTRVTARQP
jgi:DivIVA domain-containing protein